MTPRTGAKTTRRLSPQPPSVTRERVAGAPDTARPVRSERMMSKHSYKVYVCPEGMVYVYQRSARAREVMVGFALLAVAAWLVAFVELKLGQGALWPWLLLFSIVPAFVATSASRWGLAWGVPEDLAAEAVADVEPDSWGFRHVPASRADRLAVAQGGPEGAAKAHEEFLEYGHTPYFWSEAKG